MLKLIWRETARQDVRRIFEFVAELDVRAALSLKERIETTAERLTQHPYMYRTGRLPETREALIHPNYLLIYSVAADSIEVLNVLHSRQQYPPQVG
jgi:toxin ParE1/3/4